MVNEIRGACAPTDDLVDMMVVGRYRRIKGVKESVMRIVSEQRAFGGVENESGRIRRLGRIWFV